MSGESFSWVYSQDEADPGALLTPEIVEDPLLPPDLARKGLLSLPGTLAGGGGGPLRRDLTPGGWTGYTDSPPHLHPTLSAYILDLPLNRVPVTILQGGSSVIVTWPQVPQGSRGVVRKFAHVVTSGNLADSRFTTRLNNSPVQPFPGAIGAVGTLESPQDCQIILAAGDVFSVLVEHIGAVGNPSLGVAVRTYGWWWS